MGSFARRALPLLAGACAVSIGCVLPEFEKVDADMRTDGGGPNVREDGGGELPSACGLSDRLPAACDMCIRENCCDRAEACGEGTACGEDLLEPITPLADFSKDFDPLLGCMQRFCNEACEVNWGCVDDYEWPAAEGRVDVPVTGVDFTSTQDNPIPIEGVTVRACEGIDPRCSSGKRAEAVTDATGQATLEDLSAGFTGFYTFSGGMSEFGAYLPLTVRWSEPVHRAAGFLQFALNDVAVAGLAMITQVEDDFDPERGHLIVRIQGCLPLRYLNPIEPPKAEAEHVKLSFEPAEGATRVFYTAPNGGVALSLEETTTDGVGGAFNVQPSNVTVTAVDTVSGEVVATGNVQVNAGSIGFMYLLPRAK